MSTNTTSSSSSTASISTLAALQAASSSAISSTLYLPNFSNRNTVPIVDTRISKIRALLPPACLVEELPSTAALAAFVAEARSMISNILYTADSNANTLASANKPLNASNSSSALNSLASSSSDSNLQAALESHAYDDRLLVVVGPCSIHDTEAALDYARRLKPVASKLAKDLLIVMRVYFEKPRTTVGWKGLINDPSLDGNYNINLGLRVARKLMLDINSIGLPVGCEMLDTISPQFLADLISWGAIGARTTESQLHRELVSGLSFPVGFKNGTSGSIKVAVDAIVAGRYPHSFLSVTTQGLAAIVETQGNRDCHLILRGGENSPNYSAEFIEESEKLLKKSTSPISIMIDACHGNSGKDHRKTPAVTKEIAKQIANGSASIMGVMIESNIVDGNQPLNIPERNVANAANHPHGEEQHIKEKLIYGKSVTDPCVSWEATVELLEVLAEAVRERRAKLKYLNHINGTPVSQ